MRTWNFSTAKELHPKGWVRRQPEIRAEGLSGNPDKVRRDVRDSAWIGRTAEGWERVPYWLDGIIPRAYLPDNKDMIARAQTYVDAILAQQKESGNSKPMSGSLCPVSHLETACAETFSTCAKASCVIPFCLRPRRMLSPNAFEFNCFSEISASLCGFCFHYSIRIFEMQEKMRRGLFNLWLFSVEDLIP